MILGYGLCHGLYAIWNGEWGMVDEFMITHKWQSQSSGEIDRTLPTLPERSNYDILKQIPQNNSLKQETPTGYVLESICGWCEKLEYGLSRFVITPKWYHQLQNLGIGYRFCPYHIIYIHVNVVNLIIHHPQYRTTHG